MVEHTKENCSELAGRITNEMDREELCALAHEALYERFKQDPDSFYEAWDEHMIEDEERQYSDATWSLLNDEN